MESTQKYALVTGASSGIGWHISEELAKRDYSVIAVSNQPEKLDDLKIKLENAYNIIIFTVNIDLAQENAAQQIFDYCEKNNFFVEVLVNNAGTLVFREAVKVDYSLTKSIINLHVTTPALLCRLFGEQMIRRKTGFILNVSSISAVMSYPGISFYGPTKAFLRYFTRAIRIEMKRYSVKVTCLIPGATATGLYDHKKFNTPLKRTLGIIKKPETVAKAGVNALFNNRAEYIPGFLNKLIVFLLPLIPSILIGFIYKKIYSGLWKNSDG
jgi:short-subunit dehydrogenase